MKPPRDDLFMDMKAIEKSGYPEVLVLSIAEVAQELKITIGFRADPEAKMQQVDIKEALLQVGKPIFISTKSVKRPDSPAVGHITNIGQLGKLKEGIPVNESDATVPEPLKLLGVSENKENKIEPGLIQETITSAKILNTDHYTVIERDKSKIIFTPHNENSQRQQAWGNDSKIAYKFVTQVNYQVLLPEEEITDHTPLKVFYQLIYANGHHTGDFKPFTIFAYGRYPITGDADPFGICVPLDLLKEKDFETLCDTSKTDQYSKLVKNVSGIIEFFWKKPIFSNTSKQQLLDFLEYRDSYEEVDFPQQLGKTMVSKFGLSSSYPPGRGSALQVFVFQLINAKYKSAIETYYTSAVETAKQQTGDIIPEIYRIVQHFAENCFDSDPYKKASDSPNYVLWIQAKNQQSLSLNSSQTDLLMILKNKILQNAEIYLAASEQAICDFLMKCETGVMRLSTRWENLCWREVQLEMASRSGSTSVSVSTSSSSSSFYSSFFTPPPALRMDENSSSALPSTSSSSSSSSSQSNYSA